MSTHNRNNTNTNNNNKYVAPNKRQQPTTATNISGASISTATSVSTMDKDAFPTLKETLTLTHKSFAAVAKKVEVVVEVKTPLSDVPPGWIHIRRNKNKDNKNKGLIEFNYNRTDRNTSTMEDVIYEEKRLSNYLFKRRVTLQQWDRDIQNEMLGDLSPFWNTKTILEMHDDKDFQEGDYDDDNIYSDTSEN